MPSTCLMQYPIIDLLHKMESGYISSPSFNRGFVWPKDQVKNLLESIYHGYPIGMILAVEATATRFERLPSEKSHFPELREGEYFSNYMLWVIDGSQRLGVLYNTLKAINNEGVYFDLADKEFTFKPKLSHKKLAIRMSALFDYKAFMEFQENLFGQKDINSLMTGLNDLHRRFQDYQVPLQIISEIESDEMIDIFTRLNASGVSLKKTDIEKAISYKNVGRGNRRGV